MALLTPAAGFITYGLRAGKTRRMMGNFAKGDSDDGPHPGFNSEELPEISYLVHSVIDQQLGVLISKSAINTVSYYMMEFHDDLTQDWMVSFENFKEKGFENDDWRGFLERLIDKDPLLLTVYMDPKRVSSREVTTPNEHNMKVKFLHEIEPRKLAHRIVSVRENVCQELLEDLSSVKLENDDAIRFSNNWINKGKQYAMEHRSITRMPGGQSTPLRNRSFKDVSILVRFQILSHLISLVYWIVQAYRFHMFNAHECAAH